MKTAPRTLAFLLTTFAMAAPPVVHSAATVVGYELVSSVRSGRTTVDYTYRTRVQNGTPALPNASGIVTSSTAATQILEGIVQLGNLSENSVFTSTDTFTIRQDRAMSFDSSVLRWTISPGTNLPSGVFLPGAPNAPAAGATVDFDTRESLAEQGIFEASDGTRHVKHAIGLELANGATVSSVNALLGDINGRIVLMLDNWPILVIKIPDPGSLAGLQGVLSTVSTNSATASAWLLNVGAPKSLRDGYSAPLTSNALAALDSLLAVRADSAWNAATAINEISPDLRPVLVIADSFGAGPPGTNFHGSFDARDYPTGSGDACAYTGIPGRLHGYEVLSAIIGNGSPANSVTPGIFPGRPEVRAMSCGLEDSTTISARLALLLKQIRSQAPGRRIVVTNSLGFSPFKPVCDSECINAARVWRLSLTAAGLTDNDFLHVTSAANDGEPDVAVSAWAAAGLALVVPPYAAPLNNTIVVANRTTTPPSASSRPRPAGLSNDATGIEPCISNGSSPFSAIGSSVRLWSGPNASNYLDGCGSSFAAPQVSAIALYLWSIQPDLSVTEIRNILTATATPAAIFGALDSGTVLDAYAAVLALDRSITTSQTNRVRRALLDVTDVNGTDRLDGAFTYADFLKFVQEFGRRQSETRTTAPPVPPDYSRFDLNGDGFTGSGTVTSFNLDVDYSAQGAPIYNLIQEQLAPNSRLIFDEQWVSDLDVLCYYAYSDLFPISDRADIASAFALVNAQYRTLLSCQPTIKIVAETNGASLGPNGLPFSGFDKVSVNNAGQVAFVGLDTNGITQGFVTSDIGITPVTSVGSGTRVFGGSAINDATIGEAAMQDRVSGSPATFSVRKWRTDGSGQTSLVGRSSGQIGGICAGGTRAGQTCFTVGPSSPDCPNFPPFDFQFLACVAGPSGDFDSASSFVAINDSGVVAFPGLVSGSTQTALFAGTDRSNLRRLATFPMGLSPLLRPQISNTNEVVYRDDANRIAIQQYPGPASGLITSTDFSAASPFPGISANGRFVAFTATGANGPGIYLVRRTPGSTTGPNLAFPALVNSSGDPNTPAGQFTAFNAATRVAVEASVLADSSESITILFDATRAFRNSPNDPQRTVEGVYKLRANISPTGVMTASPPQPVVQVGDTLVNGKVVSSFNLWDPLSQSGQLAGFQVVFTDNNRAVVVAR